MKKLNAYTVLIVACLFFSISMFVAMTICNFRIQYVEQSILAQQKDIQQAWLDKTASSIQTWQNKIIEHARYVSASEMFRLFIVDINNFDKDELRKILLKDKNNPISEQLTYTQDLLKDLVRQEKWDDARIINVDNIEILKNEASYYKLDKEQENLIQQSLKTGKPVFGSIFKGGDRKAHIVKTSDGIETVIKDTTEKVSIDLADPLFEVLGAANAKPIASLFITIPLDKALSDFLTIVKEDKETPLLPRIINKNGNQYQMAFLNSNVVDLKDVKNPPQELDSVQFNKRTALNGNVEVYSMGIKAGSMPWLIMLETPASVIDSLINEQKWHIYGLGFIASFAITIFGAFIWARITSKRHEKEAKTLRVLYNQIRNQKIILDSVNASLNTGLVLVDKNNIVQISNPSFNQICDKKNINNLSITHIFPSAAEQKILKAINYVTLNNKPETVEVVIPDQNNEDRLYRATFYPYSVTEIEAVDAGVCVGVFQDITEFRKAAEKKKKGNLSLVSALARTIESFDPNLVGHSDKMANVANLLSRQLNMNENETETLIFASRLSQIGKIFVPHELLTKQGKLTPEELKEFEKVPEYANKILSDLPFDLPVRETVALINEREDGTGKPLGLKENEISLCGKALAIINAFIAMTSNRSWRGKSMDIEEAIEELSKNKAFNKNIVDALKNIPIENLRRAVN